MTNTIKRFLHRVMSIVTTFVIMAAPVAAIVYASEPMANNNRIQEANYSAEPVDELVLADWAENAVNEWKPDLLDDSIANTLNILKSRNNNKDKGASPDKL